MKLFYNKIGKRFFDIVVSLSAIIVLLPLFLVVAAIIKLTSKGPILFKQVRMGRNFSSFKIYKFRSMVVDAHKLGPSVTSGDDPRITAIGRVLRKSKLDELPQLFNVLFGHMSLVGPRPEVEKFVMKAKNDYHHVLSVRPGITDYAAIEYRDEESVMNGFANKEVAYVNMVLPEKIKWYKKYISEVSLFTDFKLILLTVMKIFRRSEEAPKSLSTVPAVAVEEYRKLVS